MALSKKDLMIHITMNELYNTHSLILQHIETLVCANEVLVVLPLIHIHSRRMTNNICAFSPTNWAQPLHKFLARKTEPLNSTCTVAGRLLYRTSKAPSWTLYRQATCSTWRPNRFSYNSSVLSHTRQRNALTTWPLSLSVRQRLRTLS